MKKSYISIIIFLTSIVMITTSSCSSDYLDTKPSTSVSESLIGSSIDNLYMALNGIHRKMVSQDKAVQYVGGYPGFMMCADFCTDDITWEQNDQFKDLHQWSIQKDPNNKIVKVIWESYYEFISNANIILKYIDSYIDSEPLRAQQIKGEALCFRAFSHFMLVQLYASRYITGVENTQEGIPLKLKTGISELSRNSVEECYKSINADLDQAINLLEGYKPKSLSHFSPITAYGIKARVALAQGKYDIAADNSLKAINLAEAEGYKLMEDEELLNGFSDISTNCKEALWAALTLDDQTVNYYSFNAFMSWNFNSEPIRTGAKQISSTLYNLIEDNDIRKLWWDESGTSELPNENYTSYKYAARKFKARSEGDPVGNVVFMRLAELYLIYCESALEINSNNGKTMFAKYMKTRNKNYTSEESNDELLKKIRINRRVELWGEGFRFYDLKRLGEDMKRTGANFNPGFCMVLNITAEDKRWSWAIPQNEIDANTGINQNTY